LEVYLRGESSLDSLAERLRELLNIPRQNRTPYQREQKREGANMGGEYFLFEIFGLSLTLLNNTGEVQIPERQDWPYYVFLTVDAGVDHQISKAIAEYLAQIARRAGLEAEVDSLSS
jgi:hypothetical protein